MDFKLKDLGKIKKADINLDGITVICGDNNTGKSTIGKSLFSFYNALYDYKTKINMQKDSRFKNFILSNINSMDVPVRLLDNDSTMSFITSQAEDFSVEDVKKYLEENYPIKVTKNKVASLVEYLNLPEKDILNEYVFRYFNLVMNGQIKNLNSTGKSSVTAEIKGKSDTILLNKKSCSCELDEPIEHSAYYINNPFVLDWLNLTNVSWFLSALNPMDRNVISAIIKAQADINEDSMSNILETVINKKELDEIRKVLKRAYAGDTVISHGKYYYSENGVDFDFRNISAGLKSFALIERMLETGVLKKKDILILDEPEIHLHSEWQIIYAELIVALQKYFDLTILIVTHSFQFLESLNFFMKKYGISEKGNYYIPKQTEKGVIIEDNDSNLSDMRKSLKSGMFTLADMQLDELSSGDSDEEDDE